MIKIGKNISRFSKHSYRPTSKKELISIIYDRMEKEGQNCELNDIDTSLITDMSGLFWGSSFNGNISEWDVSNVKNMSQLFRESKFNQDISNWNIREDCKTIGMFDNCPIKEEYKPESTR